MSEIGIQVISQRARDDAAYAALLRERPLEALEGYALTRAEYTTLQVLIASGWSVPTTGGRPGDDGAPDGRSGCLGQLIWLFKRLVGAGRRG